MWRKTEIDESNASGELSAHSVRVHFGGIKAVDDVDLVLRHREILGLIGPNGAGKTTLVNALTGFQKVTGGRVALGGADITGRMPRQLARMGLARTFQGVRLFSDLSVFENVELGGLGVGLSRKEARRQAWDLLERMNLAGYAGSRASSLPHGDERRLGILRALATRPHFLLLDEPAAGLNESETALLVSGILAIRETFDCGLLVIEHDMRLIMRLCDRIHVLDHGKTLCVGSPEQVQVDRGVIEAYLGTRTAAASKRDGLTIA